MSPDTWTRHYTESGRALVLPPYRIAANDRAFVARGLGDSIATPERPSAVDAWCRAQGVAPPTWEELVWVRGGR